MLRCFGGWADVNVWSIIALNSLKNRESEYKSFHLIGSSSRFLPVKRIFCLFLPLLLLLIICLLKLVASCSFGWSRSVQGKCKFMTCVCHAVHRWGKLLRQQSQCMTDDCLNFHNWTFCSGFDLPGDKSGSHGIGITTGQRSKQVLPWTSAAQPCFPP